jgi:hypothetical protein
VDWHCTGLAGPGSYGFKLLFRQTAGTYKDPASGWESVNPDSPDGPNYSILDTLDDSFKGDDSKFHFKLVWPQKTGDNYNEWKQTTNPVTQVQSVAGYEAVDVKFTAGDWGGLENGQYKGGSNPQSLLDGSVDSAEWDYAVGSKSVHSGGMPGPGTVEQEVELYVFAFIPPGLTT